MSIQRKLTLTISALMFIVLLLNVVFSHINALTVHRSNLEQQINTIANQLTVTLKLIEDTNQSVELQMARTLYSSAKSAEQLLPSKHADITNDMLVDIANMLNIDTITLWVRDEQQELLSIRSSNPAEVSLRSKTWDYWDTAMQNVYSLEPVSVKLGERFTHFYAGPLNYAVTDPSKILKFGYYYSGHTDYMINTIVSTTQLYENGYLEQQKNIVSDLLHHVEGLVEITAFNPTYFGEEKILKMKNGQLVQNLDVRDIIYGEYNYQNYEVDVSTVKAVLKDNHNQKLDFQFNSNSYSRVFIPIQADEPYVISFVFNKHVMLKKTYEQLFDHVVISVLLFVVTIIITSFVSRRIVAPVLSIKEKVKQIANQNFNFPLHIESKDELGVLATHVNEMGQRLDTYTTELKHTASQLQHTEHQLKSVIKLTNDPIALINLDYEFYNTNGAFTRLFGYSFDEVKGRSLKLLYPKNPALVEKKLKFIVDNGFTDKCELEFQTKDGDMKHISLSLSPILDINESCIGLAGIMHDMTAHHEKKQLLLQNEKLSTIGQLSASIAHEFRNPLTTLHGFLKLSQQRGQLSTDYIPLLINELEHMELILGQFLTMAKPQAYKSNKVNIEQLLKEIVHLLQSSEKLMDIELQFNIEPYPHVVCGDNKFIRQAFVNIIKNSIESMDNGGLIKISIFSSEKDVIIKVEDSGIGISEEDLAYIFDPFFTKKEFGTGLGLLVTQQIIVSHHGNISYESKKNIGTTVTVTLPKYVES